MRTVPGRGGFAGFGGLFPTHPFASAWVTNSPLSACLIAFVRTPGFTRLEASR